MIGVKSVMQQGLVLERVKARDVYLKITHDSLLLVTA